MTSTTTTLSATRQHHGSGGSIGNTILDTYRFPLFDHMIVKAWLALFQLCKGIKGDVWFWQTIKIPTLSFYGLCLPKTLEEQRLVHFCWSVQPFCWWPRRKALLLMNKGFADSSNCWQLQTNTVKDFHTWKFWNMKVTRLKNLSKTLIEQEKNIIYIISFKFKFFKTNSKWKTVFTQMKN